MILPEMHSARPFCRTHHGVGIGAMQCATGHTPAHCKWVARNCRDIAKRTLAVRAYWLAADAPPMGAAVPLLMAAGPPVPAVPAVSFEPERLHPTVPPASAAINTAVITFLSTGSIIISSSVDVTRS